jgi:hypothetical protein
MKTIAPVAFFAIGLVVLLLTPYGHFPDEQSHFQYAVYLKEHAQLPPVSFDIRSMSIPEAFQAPLYYIAGAMLLLFEFDQQQSVTLLRILSLLLGTGVIILILKTAQLLFPSTELVGLAGAMAAFNPQFIFTHSGISNISMTSFTCALTGYLIVRFIKDKKVSESMAAPLLGISFGLALLSRTITIYLLPVCAAGILLLLYQRRKLSIRTIIRSFVLFATATLLVSGWWYLRNYLYYGDPVLWTVHQTTVGAGWAKTDAVTVSYFIQGLAKLHATFWAYFGRNEFHANIAEYIVFLVIAVIGMIGSFELIFLRKNRKTLPDDSRTPYLLIALSAAIAFVEILTLQIKINSPQGRYLYMAMLPISILLASGWSNVLPEEYQTRGNRTISYFLLLWCLYVITLYWLPHYI